MSELRDLRVPGLGLAPMKPLDEIYPRDYDPLIAAFLRSKHRRSWPATLLARLQIAARLGPRTGRGAQRAARVHPRRGFTFGHVAR